MHEWVVGGAVIEATVMGSAVTDPGLLLVQNVRRGGVVDWTPPGGVIDHGESVRSGLTREVLEETGLSVTRWSGPLYRIEAEAPGLGWTLRVEVHRAERVEGALRCGEDPDGIVVAADLVPEAECGRRMGGAHLWVREPLLDWLEVRWSGCRQYRYRVEGDDPAALRISRQEAPGARRDD